MSGLPRRRSFKFGVELWGDIVWQSIVNRAPCNVGRLYAGACAITSPELGDRDRGFSSASAPSADVLSVTCTARFLAPLPSTRRLNPFPRLPWSLQQCVRVGDVDSRWPPSHERCAPAPSRHQLRCARSCRSATRWGGLKASVRTPVPRFPLRLAAGHRTSAPADR
jgi:hypothetical protein